MDLQPDPAKADMNENTDMVISALPWRPLWSLLMLCPALANSESDVLCEDCAEIMRDAS